MNVEELPEYLEEHQRHLARMQAAAVADNPQLAQVQAENEWLQTRQRLSGVAQQRTELERTKAMLAQEFPQAPPSLYESYDSPERMRAAAQTAHEAVVKAQAPAPTQTGAGSWGGPPPSSTPGADLNASPNQRKWNPEYVGDLIKRAEAYSGDGNGKPSRHVEELTDLLTENLVFSRMRTNPDGTPVRE